MNQPAAARALFAEYAAYHRDPRNVLCHEFGIPLIVLALIALLRLAHAGPVDLALVAIVAISAYYAVLARARAIPAIVALLALYAGAAYVGWVPALGLFALGWLLQFLGHGFEGNKPAFLTNLRHLLVGPLWIAQLPLPRGKPSSL